MPNYGTVGAIPASYTVPNSPSAYVAPAPTYTPAYTAPSYSSGTSSSDVYVRGYTRRDGTYVAPHMRSAPNSTKSDNWSTRGNINPYTGERGSKW